MDGHDHDHDDGHGRLAPAPAVGGRGPTGATVSDHPIDGQVLLIAGAKASVPLDRLPELLERAQSDLAGRLDDYRREFECVHETPDRAAFLVPSDHWEALGDRLGFDRRECDAARRAHEEQVHRIGSETDRSEEFESAFEIRDAVVVGTRGAGAGAGADADAGGETDD